MHFMNPVPLMTLVEVIRGQATSDETTRTVMDLAKGIGKTPVEVNDYPGFVSNRVLMPMINEAIFAVFEGVATAEAIDQVMKLGMNHPMGPLTLADFIGLDVCLAILNVLHEGLGDPKYRAVPAAQADGRRGLARPQDGPRVLQLHGGLSRPSGSEPDRSISVPMAIGLLARAPAARKSDSGGRRDVPAFMASAISASSAGRKWAWSKRTRSW